MSNSENESGTDTEQGISDEQLPEDLQPSEDNPLAEPLDEDDAETDELDMQGGKTPEQWDDEELED
jgi:hypothetical protein